MSKRFTCAAALLLCAALLMGCGSAPKAENAPAPESSASAVTAAPGDPGAPTPAPPEETAPPDPLPEKNGLYDLLEGVFDTLHFGTAGSSLVAAWYAASIVDWGVKNGPDAVRTGASAWDRGTVNEFGEELGDKLTTLYAAAYGFYGPGAALLQDCGWEGEWDHSGRDVRDVFQTLFPALGMETPLAAAAFAPDSEVQHLRAWGTILDAEDMSDPVRALNVLLVGGAIPEGAAVLSENLSGGVLTLDMNEAFAQYVRSMGTSGELLTVAAVVNTALSLIDGAESVMLTAEGKTLETGHNIYTDPISFYEE